MGVISLEAWESLILDAICPLELQTSPVNTLEISVLR